MTAPVAESTVLPFVGGDLDIKRRILGRSEVFTALDDGLFAETVRRSTLVRAQRRRPIAPKTDQALFVVGSGRVRLLRRSDDRELTLDYVGPGGLIGELRLVDEERLVETTACERVEAIRLPVPFVLQLIAESSKFGLEMVRLIGRRRLVAEERIHGFLTRSVESRVAEFLLWVAGRHGVPDSRGTLIGVKFTHQEIASYVGSTRETVTLILGDFRRRGLILVDHRRLVLIDRPGLERHASGSRP